MHSTVLLLALAGHLCSAIPVQDGPQQRLLNGLELPKSYNSVTGGGRIPFTPGHRDPYDEAVDTVGDELDPLPWRNGLGASVLGPWNKDRSRQSPDLVRPPSTDKGNLANMRWSFADSHIRIEEGGWTRQTTVRELGTSVELAAVNMRLDEGVIRELHWHKEAEWAYVLDGEVRVTALDYEGGNFIDDLKKGDIWHIPPKSVLSKNFNLDPRVFAHIPEGEKYIFQGSKPGSIDDEAPRGKQAKKSKYQFTHRMLDQEPIKSSNGGGQVRITDSNNFPISKTVSAAHAIIEPGAIREMHWHPNADEWSFFIKGRARVTIFAAEGTARTFDYLPGDVGIVPRNMGHFVENIGDEPVEMLEVFRADEFRDISLFQWMGETPQRHVADTLFADDPENAKKFLDQIQNHEHNVVTKPDFVREGGRSGMEL
ncbi:RmlC-like cupin domain-containing protein [Penicillium waksmanii]|uniref:RmlC-like cupin domain-containing protein n=1 Tax=Penicillium waksmanii TaxID=69791 RepID=UPI00254842F6|nr:RmlC-like cupin domain-containing protein [Penicillium waksmanii]KAJ5980856.1 RmlC-like cupin domain-containing protein [Penicillium waksmanii]